MSHGLDWFEESFDLDGSGDLDRLERTFMFAAMDEIDQEMAERAKGRGSFSVFDADDEDDGLDEVYGVYDDEDEED